MKCQALADGRLTNANQIHTVLFKHEEILIRLAVSNTEPFSVISQAGFVPMQFHKEPLTHMRRKWTALAVLVE